MVSLRVVVAFDSQLDVVAIVRWEDGGRGERGEEVGPPTNGERLSYRIIYYGYR